MQIFLILALLIAVIAVILMLQNLTTISVSLFLWNIHTSLALVLLVTLAAGLLIAFLLLLPASIRNKMTASSQAKKTAGLEGERDQYKKKSEEAEKEVADLEEQLASYSAALEEKNSASTNTQAK